MRFLGNFQTLCRSPTVSEKLWCVRFQQSNGFCSCAINMEYPTETLFIWESLSRRSRKNTMVEILWIFYGKTPIFAFRSRFSLDDYQCTNFVRSALTQVASSANLLFVCEICQMKIFFSSFSFRCNLRVNDVFEHPFSVLRKMKNLSLPPPPSSSFLFCWTSREL